MDSHCVLILDWDGVAVPNRTERVPRLVHELSRLLHEDVDVLLVTGTRVEFLRAQALDEVVKQLSPAARSRLWVSAQRGSEGYTVDAAGNWVTRLVRQATPAESLRLVQVSKAMLGCLEQWGLVTRLVSDRVNRFKLDLIPEEEWSALPKSQMGDYASELTRRLGKVGKSFEELGEKIQTILRKEHADGFKVTSDWKHIEVGLTDKSDSILWYKRER
jgi:hypothetical protein